MLSEFTPFLLQPDEDKESLCQLCQGLIWCFLLHQNIQPNSHLLCTMVLPQNW